ncbi:MFS transporter [Methanothermobacter tenebrarum]|uniref:MFS transporter n=1 Tax=Methanothermobacter tenebrarum TaxID=680118 RepID=A0A328PCW3_9EURY|nr:MFS transporter [Methanothermobacter tenebrarum]MBC7101024.1 MFS transporter [Methanobacteriales archaeon]MBC7117498.1 MFS transporter [Methanobacteriaceae archaeon]NPV64719.1 MFS transporter [Methanobacteriaceae archaeon]RAO79051.1 MFS transporter [Methanothermobacter tenebrarum]
MKRAGKFIILLGLVSLFADMTYEGARGITGPFLLMLGASATMVGFASGLGELSGYIIRLFSGYVADKTRRYWLITFTGYIMNLVVVPLLALAFNWQLAILLIILERIGKGFRTPARDVMLSYATSQVGHGWGFGIHEALDQVGAILGPLMVFLVLYFRGGYRTGFTFLGLPAVFAILTLVVAYFLFPSPHELEVGRAEPLRSPGSVFWLYLGVVCLIGVGYADFPLIGYHFKNVMLFGDFMIPVLYALAMLVDALSALLFGKFFDYYGFKVMIVSVILSSLFAPLAFLGGVLAAVFGVILWGVGMGAQESIMRAAIARIIPSDRRGSAYGIFNLLFGFSWFLGSLFMGIFYEISLLALVIFSVIMQLLAVPLLIRIEKSV